MRKELQAFDAMYRGRLNPRCSVKCETCGKCYGNKIEDEPRDGSPSLTIIVDETDEIVDCCHYGSVEIPESVFNEHMKQLDILRKE